MKVYKKHEKNFGFALAAVVVLLFLVVGLALSVTRITDLKSVLNLPKAAERGEIAGASGAKNPCQFQIQIGKLADSTNQFSFVVPAMEMTTARVEGIVAINGGGGNDLKKGPFVWHPGEPNIWGMTQTFNLVPDAVITQMVAWHEDTKTLRYGCGIWQRTQGKPAPLRVILDTYPYNKIRVLSQGENTLSVVFTAPRLLFETGYSRLEGINGYYDYNDQQYSWGPYRWINNTYTHIFSRKFKVALIGILGWKNPSLSTDEGIIRVRFGYGAKQLN